MANVKAKQPSFVLVDVPFPLAIGGVRVGPAEVPRNKKGKKLMKPTPVQAVIEDRDARAHGLKPIRSASMAEYVDSIRSYASGKPYVVKPAAATAEKAATVEKVQT
ncbi:MAG: hypothetical protein BWX88_02688 [Planctomycetes bacterium ADurb.Bin126]|nr:MAG: hypothetical protein BWX88_02688 [Planctomycetes bacterium ADurb.Bin126]HOD79960.1 hypothetical protein [Phycisphaerae bacterium]HQL74017.1 hypothetical protein [Phycisphaerae bacterium]